MAITGAFSSLPMMTDCPSMSAICPPRRQRSSPLDGMRRFDPAELQELVRRQVGGERRHEVVADERHAQERPEARDLVHDRLEHRLLALAARDVVLGRVELVLTRMRE